ELRDAVLARLEEESGVDLEELTLGRLPDVAAQILQYASAFPLAPRAPRRRRAAHGGLAGSRPRDRGGHVRRAVERRVVRAPRDGLGAGRSGRDRRHHLGHRAGRGRDPARSSSDRPWRRGTASAVTNVSATGAARYVGTRVTRVEDARLLTGRGTYVDDIALPGMLHACFVRSPYARAAI